MNLHRICRDCQKEEEVTIAEFVAFERGKPLLLCQPHFDEWHKKRREKSYVNYGYFNFDDQVLKRIKSINISGEVWDQVENMKAKYNEKL